MLRSMAENEPVAGCRYVWDTVCKRLLSNRQKAYNTNISSCCHVFCFVLRALRHIIIYETTTFYVCLQKQLWTDTWTLLGLSVGYLENVYKYFRKKVTYGAERHGIIIFDELKLRIGDKFDVRRLTISGLVDFTEFTPAKNRSQYADYGLVFMYHPFMGDWTQKRLLQCICHVDRLTATFCLSCCWKWLLLSKVSTRG